MAEETNTNPEIEAAIRLAGADGHELSWRTNTQNDFMWLLDRKLVTGEITPLEAKLAFRDYSNYLDAIQALENGSSNAV